MQTRLLDILSDLASSDSGINELLQTTSKEEIVSVLRRHGYELTEQEIDACMERFSQDDGELDETALETVSGGNTSCAWKALGVIIPYYTKGRETR